MNQNSHYLALSREAKTGILVIGTILLFIFGYSYLKGKNLLDSSRTFYVKYQNVEGLVKTAPVTINGLVVGKVRSIEFADKSGELIVSFSVESEFEFSNKSSVNIYSSGLIGGKSLGITPVYDPNTIAKNGDTLSGTIDDDMLVAVSKALGPLEEKVTNTLSSLDTVLTGVSDILDDRTRENLRAAIANLNTTMASFKSASNELDGILSTNSAKLDRTFTNLDDMSSNLSKFSDSLAQLETGKLVNELQDLITKFDGIATAMDNGEGTVGKLLKDDKLYDNLEGASRQLEQLLQDVKLNPKRYVNVSVFGKKQKEYVKPENPDQ